MLLQAGGVLPPRRLTNRLDEEKELHASAVYDSCHNTAEKNFREWREKFMNGFLVCDAPVELGERRSRAARRETRLLTVLALLVAALLIENCLGTSQRSVC